MSDKVELTDEMIETYTKCSEFTIAKDAGNVIATLASALQAERAKVKGWDGAPDDATKAVTEYSNGGCVLARLVHTREIPKSRIDQISEKASLAWAAEANSDEYKRELTEHIKAAILEYAEAMGEGK